MKISRNSANSASTSNIHISFLSSLNRARSLLGMGALLLLAACTTPTPPRVEPPRAEPPPLAKPAPPRLQAGSFAELPGWQADDPRQAWRPFLASCSVLVRRAEWRDVCTAAKSVNEADALAVRNFFESWFLPHRVINGDGSDQGLVTGYYEPLLRGSRRRGGPYQTPLYKVPEDLVVVDLASVYPELKSMRLRGKLQGNRLMPYPTRADIGRDNPLAGRELLWVDNAVEAFFLEVQGSGRVQLAENGETVRVAYADQNGHPYKSIGRYLVDKGEMTLDQASAMSIKNWYLANPARRQELLNANPSVVFFREERLLNPGEGPKGALGVPLTGGRSIAVDPQTVPLGAPVYLATTQPNSNQLLQRLMMAQDTGGAIRGGVRADFFWGFGNEAGEQAGRMKQRGAMWVLLPRSPL